jgi:mono/diheme cytochrome c family protein
MISMRPAATGFTALCALMLFAACITLAGCSNIHGRPGPGPEVIRPDDLVDYPTLYKENCAACHGATGSHGASIPLANPVFLAVIGEDHLHDVIAKGVPNSLMPPFAKTSGGTLTDQQITILTQGILHQWSNSADLAGQTPPSYKPTLQGDAAHGQQAFTSACARCHGPNGEGNKDHNPGPLTDATYLALVSDQYLRSNIIAGRPEAKMPDWRHYTSQPLTDQQITDIVTWLASHRTANPGQPYRTRPYPGVTP